MAVTMCANLFMGFLNIGLMVGLVFGVLIVLRPVTSRLLTPDQRVVLWGAGWVMGITPQLVSLLNYLPIPFPTLRSLTASRIEGRGIYSFPSFLPYVQKEGTYNLALPGDLAVPVQISQGTLNVLAAVLVVYLVISFAMAMVGDIWTVRRARSGEELDGKTLGVEVDNDTVIRLCAHLPTSFVIRRGFRHEIALQRELTQEQLRLVLLHEREHIRRHDPWLQGLVTMGCCFHFWNPVVWAASRLTRRDMELACDRRVLESLDESGRREYARTLVELACDGPVWGGITTFGECDAAVRVRRAAEWRPDQPPPQWKTVLSWTLTAVLAVFLLAGGPRERTLPQDVALDMARLHIWSQVEELLEEQGGTVTAQTPVWVQGEPVYASLYFQDEDGGWWKAFFRRQEFFDGEVELYLSPREEAPDLRECRVLGDVERLREEEA